MVKIEKVYWGKVKVNGQVYHQVLIIGDEVLEREKNKLENLFGTTHQIGEWEQKEILSGKPEVILIASGWNGLLKVDGEFKKKVENLGIELKVVLTPKLISEYNQLIKQDKKVNCLIHTTC
ncbi:MTH938/NDUFAF3 family protein [Patescibacteria group bacterium]|nr:MTH938/NDUFAF3 family protein [Patescibacteria group bacterium]